MKKILLSALAGILLVSCQEVPTNKDGYVIINLKNDYDYKIVVIDSCEYIRVCKSKYYNGITHKGNCRYCAERRKKEFEQLTSEKE